MPYQITYTKSDELHQLEWTLEWIVPAGWTEPAISECFLRRFPGSEILRIEARG
jgi:hypothetical protein